MFSLCGDKLDSLREIKKKMQPENCPLKGSSAVVKLADIFNMLGVPRCQRDHNFVILKILLNIFVS